MGVVYVAHDLLTGQQVALKQVKLPAGVGDASQINERLLALAHEFQALSSLRHPNIISVLDYGFDQRRQPFYTMELLENPATLSYAAKQTDTHGRIRLMIEVLTALDYLHRHGVVHRDLKPANILVDVHGVVRLLDFGVSQFRSASGEEITQYGGTLDYMAPEVLANGSATAAADLYAVGVMLSKLESGNHPFGESNGDYTHFMLRLLHDAPNLSGVPAPLVPVVSALLHKDPAQRPPSAQHVIDLLLNAYDLPLLPEREAVRESNLQASRFVGRTDEFKALRGALFGALEGNGSLWLIGGESGVGKSRLISELRAEALVEGALVVRAQAITNGDPLTVWREAVRRLALGTPDLPDEEAEPLLHIAPDLPDLLGRAIRTNPKAPTAGFSQASAAIAALVARQRQPLLLIVEDAQWAGEALEPVGLLAQQVGGHRLLVVVTYRDDEAPTLPDQFPNATLLKLQRLDARAIAELSAAMLGENGRHPTVVSYLQRETEGNAFFMVEMVRALANLSGRLAHIGKDELPTGLIPGGVRAIVQNRLERVPAALRPALTYAALLGRQIDEAAMNHLAPDMLERLLLACAEAMVMEVSDGMWQFSHDKLREGVLSNIPEPQRPHVNRQVAEAIDAIYPEDRPRAAAQMQRWHLAGDLSQEVAAAERAISYKLSIGVEIDQLTGLMDSLIERVEAAPLDERQKTDDLLKLLMSYIHYHEWLGEMEQRGQKLERAYALADRLGDPNLLAEVMCYMGDHVAWSANYALGLEYSQRAYELARTANNTYWELGALNNISRMRYYLGDVEGSMAGLRATIVRAEEIGNMRGMAVLLNNYAVMLLQMGDADGALTNILRAVDIFRQMGLTFDMHDASMFVGMIHYRQKRYAEGAQWVDEVLPQVRPTRNVEALLNGLSLSALCHHHNGDLATARTHAYEALERAHSTAAIHMISLPLIAVAHCLLSSGQAQRAAHWYGFTSVLPGTDEVLAYGELPDLLERLQTALPPATLEEAIEHGKRLDMMAEAQRLLQEVEGSANTATTA
jgi:tetratricopeptide (TPR) repeat protein